MRTKFKYRASKNGVYGFNPFLFSDFDFFTDSFHFELLCGLKGL